MENTMIDAPKYFDVRSDFWRNAFEAAAPLDRYLADSPEDKAQRWHEMATHLPDVPDTDQLRLTGYNRKMNVLVVSGVWCGDCVRQGPMLDQLGQIAGVDVRFIDRDADIELRDEVRILGAQRVPVVVFLSEDFWEVGRFGDRLLNVYRDKHENEVGAACAVPYAVPPQDKLLAELREWADVYERMLTMLRLAPALRKRYND